MYPPARGGRDLDESRFEVGEREYCKGGVMVMTPQAFDGEVKLGRLPILHSALPEVGSQPESS